MRLAAPFCFLALVALCLAASVQSFVPPAGHSQNRRCVVSSLNAAGDEKKDGGFFQGVSNFFQELDNFMDDASARRLGNGAGVYCTVNWSMESEAGPEETHTPLCLPFCLDSILRKKKIKILRNPGQESQKRSIGIHPRRRLLRTKHWWILSVDARRKWRNATRDAYEETHCGTQLSSF